MYKRFSSIFMVDSRRGFAWVGEGEEEGEEEEGEEYGVGGGE